MSEGRSLLAENWLAVLGVAAAFALSASAATADVLSFAKARCVEPLLAGKEPLTDGLVEVEASVVGAKGEPMFGTLPKYFWDGQAPYYMAWAELFETIRTCAVTRLPRGASNADPLEIKALLRSVPTSFGEVCRATEDDGTQIAVATTTDRQPRGAYVVIGVTDGDLLIFERTFAAGPCEASSE